MNSSRNLRILLLSLVAIPTSLRAQPRPIDIPELNTQFTSSGINNLRVGEMSADGTETLLLMEFTYNGNAGPNALIVPVIESRSQRGVSRWFGSDKVVVPRGRGLISIKVKFFNDEPGAPATLTTDAIRMLILNSAGNTIVGGSTELKTIHWGKEGLQPIKSAVSPKPQEQKLAQLAGEAEERARDKARRAAEAEEKARQEAADREAARVKAEADANEREAARLKAKNEELRLEKERREAEDKAKAEAEEKEKARLEAEARKREEERQAAAAEAARLEVESKVAEQKVRAEEAAKKEAADRAAAEAKTREQAEAQAAEAARIRKEQETLAAAKLKAEQEARDAEVAALAESKSRTHITNVDVVNRSLDRSQMTFGIEFDRRDKFKYLGVNVEHSANPATENYFTCEPKEVGRQKYALVQVAYSKPVSPSSSMVTDRLEIFGCDSPEAKKAIPLHTATMLLVWRPPGGSTPPPAAAAPAEPKGLVELTEFRQRTPASGYASVTYNLPSGTGQLRVQLQNSAQPASTNWFVIDPVAVRAGQGLELIPVTVSSEASTPTGPLTVDTIRAELVDASGKVIGQSAKSTSITWSRGQ